MQTHQLNQSTLTGQLIHVCKTGSDDNTGITSAPFKTISAASKHAMPGDTILVQAGSYRERIDPPRGGASAQNPITYQAAKGELVELLGSELIMDWQRIDETVWQASVRNEMFGEFNPYSDLIRGDWFNDQNRPHHTGALYLNNAPLVEAATRDAIAPMYWFAKVEATETIFWANFGNHDPNSTQTEINVRPTVFYPSQTGINYITVRGFSMRHAATNWAPPTAEQIGLVGTHWSKGWIIENNTISHSRCCGISLGKYGDAYDNTSQDKAVGYDQTIERALNHNWNRAHVGSHIVRNNHISFCEQAGIVGSLGAIFSSITGNTIHDIYQQRLFSGEEQAGIKIHAPIDTLIANNRIFRAYRGIWMDWMTQGTRIHRNLCYDNSEEDLYLEVNHGPYIVDHNLLLSARSLRSCSQGGAYIHNLFAGKLLGEAVLGRTTPYHVPHSTELAGSANIQGGDERFYNNLIVDQAGYQQHADPIRPCAPNQGKDGIMTGHAAPIHTGGNVCIPDWAGFQIKADQLTLQIGKAREPLDTSAPERVNSETLGRTQLTGLPYMDVDGKALTFDTDYFGSPHMRHTPEAGPFTDSSVNCVRLIHSPACIHN